jgi:hypothetical protein
MKKYFLASAECGLLATKLLILLYLAVASNEALKERLPFVLAALDILTAQVEKRLEPSGEKGKK